MNDYVLDVRRLLTDVRDLCGKLDLLTGSKPAGRGLLVRCFQPDHQERNASCSVQQGQDGTIFYKCQTACGASGDALSMIATIYDLDLRSDFREILAIGAELGGDLVTAEAIAVELAPLEEKLCDELDADPMAVTPQWGLND